MPGRKITNPLNGEPTDTTHDADWFNRIESVVESGGAGGSSANAYVYDQAGNLVYDGRFYYQYDAWNRLLKINRVPAQVPAPVFNAQGVMTAGNPGDWLVHYVYDGLGRLIRRQTPWPEAGIPGNEIKRFEHYYYDGVRRIAETFTDPLPAGEGGDASMEEEGEAPPAPTTYTWTEREYVWGPGYVDELVAQLGGGEAQSSQNAVRYSIQDANYNVVALVGGQTPGGGSVLGGFGGVLEQYTYDPYGSLLFTDTIVTGGTPQDPALPRNRVGHQGRFADRFDVATALPQLMLGARFHYHNNTRTYSPLLGRFLQSDLNGTGIWLGGAPHSGQGTGLEWFKLDAMSLYGDGMNLYGYLGSTPVNVVDPQGLFMGLAGLFGPSSIMEFQFDQMMDAVQTGFALKNALRDTFGSYAADMETDLDWALDWSQPDDIYSRRGNFTSDYDGSGASGGPEFAMSGLVRTIGNATNHLRGKWVTVVEAMSDRARAYQKTITGRPGKAYMLNGVKFDGIKGATLVDAKGPGYSNFIDKNGNFYSWFQGRQGLINQAQNQVKAARGAPIVWYVAEREAAKAIQRVVGRAVTVIHRAAQ